MSRLGSGQWPSWAVQVISGHGVVGVWSLAEGQRRQPGWGGPGVLLSDPPPSLLLPFYFLYPAANHSPPLALSPPSRPYSTYLGQSPERPEFSASLESLLSFCSLFQQGSQVMGTLIFWAPAPEGEQLSRMRSACGSDSGKETNSRDPGTDRTTEPGSGRQGGLRRHSWDSK